jgi:hypothetical protein
MKDEIGGTCGMHYAKEHKYAQGFGRENLKKREHSENLDVCGRVILKWLLKKWVRRVRTRFSRLRT